MKILVIGNFAIDSFGTHIYDNLQILNYNVDKFEFLPNTYSYNNYIEFIVKKYYRSIYSLLINFNKFRIIRLKNFFKKIKILQPDLIIVTHDYFWPAEIKKIKNITINSKIVLWFPDPISNFGKAYFLEANYDFYFFKDIYIINKLKKFSTKKIFYLPECFNPNKHYFNDPIKDNYLSDLSCIGNFHSWRSLCFTPLLHLYNMKFYGVNPSNWIKSSSLNNIFQGFTAYNQKKAEIFCRSKINLNNLQYGEILGQNVRLFEIAGSGGFQLIQYNESLDDLFINGEEIISYNSTNDLIDKINYYLTNEDERNKIISASKKRALNEHTYIHRINLLIETVFNNGVGFKSNLLK